MGVAVAAGFGLLLLLRDSDDEESHTPAERPAVSADGDVPYDPHDNYLPPECEPRRVATAVMQFLDAFNRGDRGVLRFVASVPEFRFYGVNVPRGTEPRGTPERGSKRPAGLLDYMRRRHAERERVRLQEMAVGEAYRKFAQRPTTGPHGKDPIAVFTFEVTRTARDLREQGIRTQDGGGKAGINCRTRRIFLWAQSWGLNPPGVSNPEILTCPKATIQATRSSAIVCAPGYREVNEAVAVTLPNDSPG